MWKPLIQGTLKWDPAIGILTVGMYATLSKTITASDVLSYASLLGDTNPIHLDAEFAASTPFKRPIAHGMLSAGLIPTVFGAQIPSCVYVQQSLQFKRPVFVGDSVTCHVKVISVKDKVGRNGVQPLVTCSTNVMIDSSGKCAIEGEAVCLLPFIPSAPLV